MTDEQTERSDQPDPLAEAHRLIKQDAEQRALACAAEVQAVLDKYGMQLHVATPQVTIRPV